MGGRGGGSHRANGGGGVGGMAQARSFLERAYGVHHASMIMNYLNRAPEAIRSLWEEFAGSFRAARTDPESSDAYYSSQTDNVTLGINQVARGDSIHPPYATIFHEYGHMTDYLIARKLGAGRHTAYSDIYKNGLLGKTAKAELTGHINRFLQLNPRYRRADAVDMLIREVKSKYNMLDRSDISDMFEGAGIGRGFPLGSGHGLTYWSNRGNGKEIFAEITSAEAAHPGSLKAIKEYFPQTYAVYHQMLKERKNR